MPTFKKFSSSKNTATLDSTSSKDAPPDGKQEAPIESSENALPAYIQGAWLAAYGDQPQERGAEKVLNKIADIQEALTISPEKQALVETLAGPAKALMDSPQIADAIHKGMEAFMDAVPPLMDALDKIAEIHPFIKVVILAFKAVYTLEKKRRENDQRVLALYAEMKDMMTVLLQLGGMTDPKKTGPDGRTVGGRMQKLCEDAAVDVRQCANACETYLKKGILVKVFAGPIWDVRLVKFVGVFAERKEQFKFALAIHTAVAVDAAVLKLDVIDVRTANLTRKMEAFLDVFQGFVTPQQKELEEKVEKMGKDAVLENEQAMKELAESIATTRPGHRNDGSGSFDFAELQREIKGDPDEAIQKNAEFFNAKFYIQSREILEGVAREIGQAGDRIITAVTAGPHDRVVDEDIYNIWKDMGWRGSVKARHFVMTLSSYYLEKAAEKSSLKADPDRWAVGYINIGRAQNILEAFDNDNSGFITINEVNHFTRSRPPGWSLPHWVAYWAIGLQVTSTMYCERIEEIFDAMISLTREVLPENRFRVCNYVLDVWKQVAVFVQSVKREEYTDELKSKFEFRIIAEEDRLRRNFEVTNYRVDGPDTIRVISGDGRLETTLLPMMYLALKRHLEVMSLARKYVISDSEFCDVSRLMYSIVDVALDRMESLESIFAQQNLKAKEQFGIFAGKLYDIGSTHGMNFFYDKQFREVTVPTPRGDEIIPDPDSVPLSVLNHPVGKRHEIDFAAYDLPELTPTHTEGDHPVLGVYYGFMYRSMGPKDAMIKLSLDKGEKEQTFVASGTHYVGSWEQNYEITGNWGSPLADGRIPVVLKMAYKAARWCDMEMEGVFDPEQNSLRGTSSGKYMSPGDFLFKRDPDFVRFYPAPSFINARRRWEFALTAVLDRVRRQSWSPKRISKQIKDGKRYMELVIRRRYGRKPTWGEVSELLDLLPGLYEADARFYASLINIHLSNTYIFGGERCDNCSSVLGGLRIICMDCPGEKTMNLCSEPECVNSTIIFEAADRKPHLPSHRVVKTRRPIYDREFGRVEQDARGMFNLSHAIFQQPREGEEESGGCIRCKAVLLPPCWYCFDCPPGEYYVCDNCEKKDLAFDETHTKLHMTVKISKNAGEKKRSTEERLQSLEEELAKISRTLVQILGKRCENGKGVEGS